MHMRTEDEGWQKESELGKAGFGEDRFWLAVNYGDAGVEPHGPGGGGVLNMH